MKILVIENSAVLCQRLLTLLTMNGKYEVVGCVDSPKAAFAVIANSRPDGILLDLHLNDGSGFFFLGALQERGLHLPVVVLSESQSAQYRNRAQELGAAAFLCKSDEFDEIIPTLDRLLHQPSGYPATHRENEK